MTPTAGGGRSQTARYGRGVERQGAWRHAQTRAGQQQFLDYSRNRQPDFESVTVADLNALAAEYFVPDKAAKFIVEPAAK